MIPVELDGQGPRYRQITRALLKAIADGTLPPGARVPSTRQLARELACARNIVLLAYEQLILEGYLVALPRAHTIVSPELPRRVAPPRRSDDAESPLSPAGRKLVSIAKRARNLGQWMKRCPIDFAYGTCEPDPRTMRRLRSIFSTSIASGTMGAANPAGDPGLRQEIADRLRGNRGIACSPSQIVVTNGTQQALEICSKLLLNDDDRVAMEDPGYDAARAVFAAAGAAIVPVPVDDEGIDVARLSKEADIRLVYVTPSHQFPTGAVLSAPRRHALLAWAPEQQGIHHRR